MSGRPTLPLPLPLPCPAPARRRRRRSKFPNPDCGQKSIILNVTENVWPPCPVPALPTLPCPALALRGGGDRNSQILIAARNPLFSA